MPGDLIPNVWRDEDEPDFFTRDGIGADPTLDYSGYEDRGDFDLTTVDGLLDHLAHCEEEVVSGVRDGLNAWERAAHEREGRDDWPSPYNSPFHTADCYRRDEHIAPDQCAVD